MRVLKELAMDLDVSKELATSLRVSRMSATNPESLKMPAVILEVLLSFLSQPRHNQNIFWKRILLRH